MNLQQDDLVVPVYSSLVLLAALVKSNPKTIQRLKINEYKMQAHESTHEGFFQ